MLVSKAARRYSSALLEIALDLKVVDKTLEDVLFVKNTIDDSKELVTFLKSPGVKPSDKKIALDTIFQKHVGELMMKFMTLIAKKERASILNEIVTGFITVYNDYAGIIEVEVHSARKLSKAQVEKLQANLEKTTSKKVNLALHEQEELKGGLLVKIDDTVIDGTIKHKLEQLEATLLDKSVELN